MLGSILLGVVYFMLHMDGIKDPALYAQISDSRGGAGAGAAKASSSAAR